MPNQSGLFGITSNTADRMLFGAGALYRNYGTVDQEKIGATRGGAEFQIEREDRDVDLDGRRGPMEGLVRTVGTEVTLTVTVPEISDQTWQDITRGTKTTNNSKTQIAPPEESRIPNSQFYENISLVAEEYGTGNTKAIILKNALVRGNWSVETEDLGEAGLQITFRAHYKNNDQNDPPYRIGSLSELLRDWDPNQDLSGQTLTERIYGKDGTLGSTTGSDSNDPAWVSSPPTLQFDEDDYVTESSDIWTTT